jgi:hypothetical protein
MFKRKSAVRARTCAGVSKPGMELDCYRKLEAILQTSSVARLEGSNPSPSATTSLDLDKISSCKKRNEGKGEDTEAACSASASEVGISDCLGRDPLVRSLPLVGPDLVERHSITSLQLCMRKQEHQLTEPCEPCSSAQMYWDCSLLEPL